MVRFLQRILSIINHGKDEHNMENNRMERVQSIINSLTSGQLYRLYNFLGIVLSGKAGKGTDKEIICCIMNLPREDIKPFTDILQAVQK